MSHKLSSRLIAGARKQGSSLLDENGELWAPNRIARKLPELDWNPEKRHAQLQKHRLQLLTKAMAIYVLVCASPACKPYARAFQKVLRTRSDTGLASLIVRLIFPSLRNEGAKGSHTCATIAAAMVRLVHLDVSPDRVHMFAKKPGQSITRWAAEGRRMPSGQAAKRANLAKKSLKLAAARSPRWMIGKSVKRDRDRVLAELELVSRATGRFRVIRHVRLKPMHVEARKTRWKRIKRALKSG